MILNPKTMGTIKFYPLFIILITLSTASFAQTVGNESAAATIFQSLSIENNVGLNFGDIIPSNAAGRVTVAYDGSRTGNNGISFIPSSPGTVSAAQFTVTGAPNAAYSITLPNNNSVTLSRSGGVDMRVVQFNHSIGAATPTLDVNGSQVFTVGARLRVNANQASGLYSGEFQVTVTYN